MKYLTEDLLELASAELTDWGLLYGVVCALPFGLLPVDELSERVSPGVRGVSKTKYPC
jgi:hypothetical protein